MTDAPPPFDLDNAWALFANTHGAQAAVARLAFREIQKQEKTIDALEERVREYRAEWENACERYDFQTDRLAEAVKDLAATRDIIEFARVLTARVQSGDEYDTQVQNLMDAVIKAGIYTP